MGEDCEFCAMPLEECASARAEQKKCCPDCDHGPLSPAQAYIVALNVRLASITTELDALREERDLWRSQQIRSEQMRLRLEAKVELLVEALPVDLLEAVAARIDLGAAEYHELCCEWMLWSGDESLFVEMPECDCRGDEIVSALMAARAALAPTEAVEKGERDG